MIMTVPVDRHTRFFVTAIAVLLAVFAVGWWFGTASMLKSAEASLPNPGRL